MSARVAFKQSDIERVMRAAKKLGLQVEIDLATGQARTLTDKSADEQMTDLQKWRAAKDARRAASRS
jgi:3-isopropylmalate dehydratase small subunit